MLKLVYLSAARRDILDILDYITRETGSLTFAQKFTHSIRGQCKKIADLSGTSGHSMLGRSRPELRSDIRSFPFKNYVIFFRYGEKTLEIVNVLHGHRDTELYYNNVDSSSLKDH